MRLVVILGSIALLLGGGCKKKETPAPARAPAMAPAPAPAPAASPAPAPPPEVYKPRYAQRMFEVLLRFHLAGRSVAKGNWGYAHQQAFELVETFRHDLTKVLPATRIPAGVDLKGLRSAFTDTQLVALLAATEKKDRAAFDKAYKETAAGCNSCHNQVGRQFLVLRETPGKDVEDLIDLAAGAGK